MQAFLKAIEGHISRSRVLTDPLSLHAYSHDASHYVLIPKAVVRVDSELEVQAILKAANQYQVPITFRAAGTSLSGQSISDSVLVVLNENWRDYKILEHAEIIKLQAGVLGGEANLYLAPFKRKIGPDPASISSAKIAGIAANNSSGMCCGTKHNSYHTLNSIRVIFADGSILDTADKASIAAFASSHSAWLAALSNMRDSIINDSELFHKIRRKYAIKNTIGYSLNAFIDFEDPIEILAHLMIGSEGTLGFISEVTYRTVPDYTYKKAALFFFDNLQMATEAVQVLRQTEPEAIELLDGISLDCAKAHLGQYLPAQFNIEMAALLVDVRGNAADEINQQIEAIYNKLNQVKGFCFDTGFFDGKEYRQIWQVREGYFAMVATMREAGTVVLIEDFAVPFEHLPEAVAELKQLFKNLGFEKSSIFGHAKDANLHFVMTLKFDVESELKRYELLMNKLADLIVNRYQGSLKAEHGTGRNMAPFVEMEWGQTANKLMWQLKALLDPNAVLNPDVILSKDHELHLKNLKKVPELTSLIDKCLECGFCEKVCPSRELTLSPRQRIVALRSMELLKQTDPVQFQSLQKAFEYSGAETCAATGMCGEVCPVGINTGLAIKNWRSQHLTQVKHGLLSLASRYQKLTLKLLGFALRATGKASKPLFQSTALKPANELNKKVVFYPSCGCRLLDNSTESEAQLLKEILNKLGYQVIVPDLRNECCGLMYESEGAMDVAYKKRQDLIKALQLASEDGNLPIITENSSCALELQTKGARLSLQDSWHFLSQALRDYPVRLLNKTVMLHINCSVSRLKEKEAMLSLARRCAKEVIAPPDIYCCGFAGSKGFTVPELNKNALKTLASQVPANCQEGYTCLQPCQIGLSKHSGIPYYSLLHLIRESISD
ncbi:MAG: 4Fe-4S ferredoxin [Gammaproteobacteria bacterium]|nr:4Fe-4S ferredoxin [Gammaproteobacteria bacterium]